MIHLACDSCGQAFNVPDSFAGRSGRCKRCGAKIQVPQPVAVGASADDDSVSAEAPAKIPPRTRRLLADAARIEQVFQDHPCITVTREQGNPTDVYHVRYELNSLAVGNNGKPAPRHDHEVRIELTLDYPRLAPMCKMLTPIFHPNIDQTTICVGDHWVAGEQLADLIVRIGQMIAYQAYNIKSPLNAEAAMWADLHTAELPIDSRDLWPARMH